ncbi:MAG TPA: hypothetical protein VLY63_07335 [Anaerolineae bacterium]|nr:hypothetical protein [Anaerolineae bacterium]
MFGKQEVNNGNIYYIRVKGTLDEKWADWFEGFVMAPGGNGETQLTGAVADQAALQGVLSKIHGLGLPLLLVAETGCPCPSKNCPRHGHCQECAAHYGDKAITPFCFRAKTRWAKRCAEITNAR